MHNFSKTPKQTDGTRVSSMQKRMAKVKSSRPSDVMGYDCMPDSRESSPKPNWFEDMTENARAKYAYEFGGQTFLFRGNTCAVVSYPRRDFTVAVSDMDAGQIFWLNMKMVQGLVRLATKQGERIVKKREPDNSRVLGSDIGAEARDIRDWALGRRLPRK